MPVLVREGRGSERGKGEGKGAKDTGCLGGVGVKGVGGNDADAGVFPCIIWG
jgi:hypothetical protein